MSIMTKEVKSSFSKTHDGWIIGWRNSLVENIIKVGVLEERMALNLLSIALARAQSSRRVTGQELIWVKCELKSIDKGHDVPFEVSRRRREA